MKKSFNESVGKIHSLMERMGSNMTAYEAILNEETKIMEASTKSRVQVSRDEILSILDGADKAQNDSNKGLFATVTYIKPAEILKKKTKVDVNRLSTALDNHQDRNSEQWHQDLTRFKDAEKSSTDNPIRSIITVTRYHLRWQSPENYNNDYNEYSKGLRNLRMKHGIAIERDGVLGDNHNQREKTDATSAGKFNQTQNLARDYNMIHAIDKKSTAYIVDEEGHVVSEIPSDVMWSIHGKISPRGGVEREVRDALSGEALEAYAKDKAELDATFDPKNLLFDKTLCICCSVNGVSYYYINDKIISAISKGSSVYVNQEDMVNIAKEQLGESFEVMQGFEK
jgi:hypothetical protein